MQTVNDTVNEIHAQFSEHFNGVRVFFLIHRNKEGGKSESNDKNTIKRMSSDTDEARRVLVELIEFALKDDRPFRLQMSANMRDVDKAIRLFKQRQLDNDYYDTRSKRSFYLDIKNRWISALMNPASRAGSKFLFDCDSEEELTGTLKKLEAAGITPELQYRTKNGWHIITNPHDPRLTSSESVVPNKDGLMLLWWKK